MFIFAVVFLIPIVTHHVFCGAVEWMYIRLGRTNLAREAVSDFQKKTFRKYYIIYEKNKGPVTVDRGKSFACCINQPTFAFAEVSGNKRRTE